MATKEQFDKYFKDRPQLGASEFLGEIASRYGKNSTQYKEARQYLGFDTGGYVGIISNKGGNQLGNESGSMNDFIDNFNKQQEEYIKTSQDAYGIETGRGTRKYEEGKQDLTTDYNKIISDYDYQKKQEDIALSRASEDYSRYIGNIQSETNRQLALQSKDFSVKLSQASNAYGQRGLLRSGLQTQQVGEATGDYKESQDYFKTQQQQLIDKASREFQRINEDKEMSSERRNQLLSEAKNKYDTLLQRNIQGLQEYKSDREAGSSILKTQLQSQGDILFNTTMGNISDLQRRQADQDTINKAYGTYAPGVRTPYRLSGKYIL